MELGNPRREARGQRCATGLLERVTPRVPATAGTLVLPRLQRRPLMLARSGARVLRWSHSHLLTACHASTRGSLVPTAGDSSPRDTVGDTRQGHSRTRCNTSRIGHDATVPAFRTRPRRRGRQAGTRTRVELRTRSMRRRQPRRRRRPAPQTSRSRRPRRSTPGTKRPTRQSARARTLPRSCSSPTPPTTSHRVGNCGKPSSSPLHGHRFKVRAAAGTIALITQ